MACQAINSWSFSELVAAFLDLSIAYCLLFASAFSYLASKFLALFGLCLPCPCDGLFWNPRNNNHCLQRQLVDCPYEKISLVHSAARTKTPFETLWVDGDRDWIGNLDPKLASEVNRENESGELECGKSSDLFKSGVEFGAVNVEGLKEEELDLKGKRVVGWRLRHGLRRRRRVGSVNYGKLSSVSSYDTLRSDARNTPQSPPSISKNGDEALEDANDFGGDREASTDFGFFERASLGREFNDLNEENKCGEAEQVEGLRGKIQGDLGVDKNAKNMVRVLEQALEEEHAARSALYIELEKERSAAASAADEAMAMILRLQEEKALIEMEARQYQRMIEAKAAYDGEEMNILKEILLRREREKHFLEKEVEAYRQMVLENDQFDSDAQEVAVTTLYSSENPMLMLQEINESIEPELKIVKNSSDYEVKSIESQNRTIAFKNELDIPELVEDDESLKPMLSAVPYQESKDSPNLVLDVESCIYDVHVMDEESKRSNATSNKTRKFGCSSFTVLETLYDVNRSCSDIAREKPKFADLRRNSMSAVDQERLKIDDEVEWLRERLRMVQQRREKLSFSAGHKEREKLQLQLLEDIAGQLREIRQLNDPGKAERQASLPPSYSKVTSKKRRWRSSSLTIHRST